MKIIHFYSIRSEIIRMKCNCITLKPNEILIFINENEVCGKTRFMLRRDRNSLCKLVSRK